MEKISENKRMMVAENARSCEDKKSRVSGESMVETWNS
jgi:hypothetical protein